MASLFVDDQGVPPQPAGGLGDRSAGAMLAGAVAAALFDRARTGEGAVVTTSLLATGLWMLGSDVSDNLVAGQPTRQADRRSTSFPTVNCFMAADGRWFWLQMMEPERLWHAFLQAIDAPWLDEDPRFSGGERKKLAAAAGALVEALDEIFRVERREEWERRLRSADIPFAPVMTIDEVVCDPVALESGAIVPVTNGGRDPATVLGSPCRFDGQPTFAPGPAPFVGQHTRELLHELHYADSEIDALGEAGVIPVPPGCDNGSVNGATPTMETITFASPERTTK
jgi:crotonobetainyl-CoA:carnitine CoA-transferase CaiB-like acyl-CoA transferase